MRGRVLEVVWDLFLELVMRLMSIVEVRSGIGLLVIVL